MEKVLYDEMRESETEHWWFQARREILLQVTKTFVPKGAAILDVGCGTGFILEKLKHDYDAHGLDHAEVAVDHCHKRGLTFVKHGLLGEETFNGKKFQLISFLDVIEHIEDDLTVVSMAKQYLSENGIVMITVPAFEFLWSAHDEIHHHKRRYTKQTLTALLEKAGYTVRYSSYFNTLLFPMIALVRVVGNLSGRRNASDAKPENKLINDVLYRVFKSERALLPNMSLPFGVSLLAIAEVKKP
ncbi:MAG: class I SAM-dependent methyltransferase [Chloroherpetonaceae bacterium]